MNKELNQTRSLVLMALMVALTMVGTYIIRIPVPATQGYIHMGDAFLFLSVILLGGKRGAVSGALGETLADLLAGYAAFAPITFVVKCLMGLVIGYAVRLYQLHGRKEKEEKGKQKSIFCLSAFLALLCAGGVMILGYYLGESLMYGSWVTPLVEIPMNILQFAVGVILGTAAGKLLGNSPVGRYYYRYK